MPDPAPANLPNEEHLPPDYQNFIPALRNVGYTFEESVADIVDNSIDAHATHVRIRFVIREGGQVDLLIADDGRGMNAEELRNAMVFGTQQTVEVQRQRLGLFGLGLKMASIAQAKNVHVVSLKNGALSGRAWTDDGLQRGFYCEVLDRASMERITPLSRIPSDAGHGTWVLWENLRRYEDQFASPDVLCDQLIRLLQKHLGLHLHGFLSPHGSLTISLDVVRQVLRNGVPTLTAGPKSDVKPFDPFGYGASVHPGYPAIFIAAGEYSDKLAITGHIWPPNSESDNYKLPGGAVRRQGIYFYRNGRLISGGGWCGIKETDTHDSLGRVEIHLSNVELERNTSGTNVDVRKSLVKVTPAMRDAIHNSKTAEGITFKEYLAAVNKAYRARNDGGGGGGGGPAGAGKTPLVPTGGGFPAAVQEKIRKLAGGTGDKGDQRPFRFDWVDFDDPEKDLLFRLDHGKCVCFLNNRFSGLPSFAGNGHAGGTLVKTLLFTILGDYCNKTSLTGTDEARLHDLGMLLGLAAAEEQGSVGRN